jgi:hypothetical protein
MRARHRRRSGIALAVVILAAGAIAAIFALQASGQSAKERFLSGPAAKFIKFGDPDQQSGKDTPGVARGLGSPTSYAAQQLQALAYPSHTVLASQLRGERNFFVNNIAPRGPAGPNSWRQVGPTTSTQPAFLNFFDQYAGNNFQSNDMQVAGRVGAMAIAPDCNVHHCMLWVGAAGGGVWRNDNALDPHSHWTFLSGGFGLNAIGSLLYVAKTHTLYAGTGEPNTSGDSEAGVGVYASTDNGNTWTLLPGSPDAAYARGIASMAVDPKHPNTLYIGTARAVRGFSSVCCGSITLAPDAPQWGLWKSTDGGKHFSFVFDGPSNLSVRGVNEVQIDSAHHTIYVGLMGHGIWRSSDGGNTWEQVFATQDAGDAFARTEFALNYTQPGNHTRIYVGDGGVETSGGLFPTANTGVYRADSIDTTPASSLTDGTHNPGYISLTSDGSTSAGRRDSRFGSYDYCEGQCSYDNFVVSPAGHPNDVYIGGSMDYNWYPVWGARSVLLSQDGGQTWTDQSSSADTKVGIHPDQHALVTDPANPLLFFEGSDGGVVRSSGQLTNNAHAFCDPAVTDGFTTSTSSVYAACLTLHGAVPTSLSTIDAGLGTLQFSNVVFNPNNPSQLMGGTQDNGTWLGTNNTNAWNQTIYGDGGVATFDDAPGGNANYAMNEFFLWYTDGNFRGGNPADWVVLSGPFFNCDTSGNCTPKESPEFYKPQIGDPVHAGTFFVGLQSVWRTQDYGGDPSHLEGPGPFARGTHCSEFTTSGAQPGCGDFVALGGPGGTGSASDLTSANFGSTRVGGAVTAIARTPENSGTLWAATATGRVFISNNADTADSNSVTFTRLDTLASNAPGRYVTGLTVNPTNPNEAWITYDGYNANTPTTPGHVFQIDYNPSGGTATWTNLDGNTSALNDRLGNLPVTGIARDDSTGTLYVATDFEVLADKQNKNGTYSNAWKPVGTGMPMVEIASVTVDPSTHTLYAATHGLGIWSISLKGGPH